MAEDVAVDLRPRLRAEQAETMAMSLSGGGFLAATPAELVVVPRLEPLGNARVHLAYQLWTMSDTERRFFLIDAHDGGVVFAADDSQTESVAGTGVGARGGRRKLSVQRVSDSEYRAVDGLRPPAIFTYDLNFNAAAVTRFATTGLIEASFVARDADNRWSDAMASDGHAYLGWTYDYFYKRHHRRGLDDKDLRVIALIHVDRFANAFWNRLNRSMTFGDGAGIRGPYTQSLEVVAHEFTHGVTQFSWDAGPLAQTAALNESFSDIMGSAVEWYYQSPGDGYDKADYWHGEDLSTSTSFAPQTFVTRAPFDPSLLCRSSPTLGVYCNPDHFSKYRPEVDIHYNGDIANHAYYLLVEGGTNRTSGLRVNGLGRDNREKVEKIFYRGYTAYLTPTATFLDARRATIQAARELYGAAGVEAAETALAWNAVGVLEP